MRELSLELLSAELRGRSLGAVLPACVALQVRCRPAARGWEQSGEVVVTQSPQEASRASASLVGQTFSLVGSVVTAYHFLSNTTPA